MSFDRNDDNNTTLFKCDTCPATLSLIGTFGDCAEACRSKGWIMLKRIGYDWSHHCPACAPAAEKDHVEYKQREAERERVKARNA
jgi:hypothetical protein